MASSFFFAASPVRSFVRSFFAVCMCLSIPPKRFVARFESLTDFRGVVRSCRMVTGALGRDGLHALPITVSEVVQGVSPLHRARCAATENAMDTSESTLEKH